MQLFERVRLLAKAKERSITAFSDKLDIAQSKFNGYLKESRQSNLWDLLPKILELYPDVNRDWLYFGEGEMLGENTSHENIAELKAKIKELEEENTEINKINRQLTARLLVGESEKAGVTKKTA